MFWLKYKKSSSGKIKIPNRSYYVIDIKLLFMLVVIVEIQLYVLHKKK